MNDNNTFSLDAVLSRIQSKARQAAGELKEVNRLLTELQKADHSLSGADLERILNSAFDNAGKYGQTVTDYLSSILEAARMGSKNAEAFAGLSAALQSACGISADLAAKYLLAADGAFAMNGSVGELTRTLDGACKLADRHSLSMAELTEGLAAVSTQAAASGMDIRETTAALATLLTTTRLNGTEAANALSGLLLSLRQAAEETDRTGLNANTFSGFEKACRSLGVSLSEVRNGTLRLKEPMQVLKELSEAYHAQDTSGTERAALLDATGFGPFQTEAMDAFLKNYGLYEEMLQDYADGTGTLSKETAKAASTWESSLNRLSNTWTETMGNLISSKDMVSLIDHLNELLTVLDKLAAAAGHLGSLNVLSFLGGGLLGAKNLG